jgi:hypothetical protein
MKRNVAVFWHAERAGSLDSKLVGAVGMIYTPAFDDKVQHIPLLLL